MTTPGDLLDRLGVRWSQVTDPSYGYSGAFTPRCAFGHWTASASGSDTSEDVLWARCYHACVSRSGVVKLGGWQVRQGHGGEGRSTPLRLAVGGQMSLDQLQAWQRSTQADDTSSGPNQYGYGVCIDNNGVGEQPSGEQWFAWCAAMATFAVLGGATGPGWVIDHSASTNRKIDLSASPALPVPDWWADINEAIADLLRPGLPPPSPTPKDSVMYDYLRSAEDGHTWAADGMHVRWLRTDWSNDHWRTLVGWATGREPADVVPTPTSRASINSGEWGIVAGELPPW